MKIWLVMMIEKLDVPFEEHVNVFPDRAFKSKESAEKHAEKMNAEHGGKFTMNYYNEPYVREYMVEKDPIELEEEA